MHVGFIHCNTLYYTGIIDHRHTSTLASIIIMLYQSPGMYHHTHACVVCILSHVCPLPSGRRVSFSSLHYGISSCEHWGHQHSWLDHLLHTGTCTGQSLSDLPLTHTLTHSHHIQIRMQTTHTHTHTACMPLTTHTHTYMHTLYCPSLLTHTTCLSLVCVCGVVCVWTYIYAYSHVHNKCTASLKPPRLCF